MTAILGIVRCAGASFQRDSPHLVLRPGPLGEESFALGTMFFILLCALIGLFVRGLSGMLVGALIGWTLSAIARAIVRNALLKVQSQFFESTFSVMGALCKADGVVTRDEIAAAEHMFDKLHLSDEQRKEAKAAFSRGKAPGFDLDAEVSHFARISRGNSILGRMFLQVQLAAITADGEIHPAEREMLVRIARGMGLAEVEIAQLEALLRAASYGPVSADSPPTQQRLNDAYAALNVSPDADQVTVKRAYRKLIAENHPDRLASKGLPENMRELAEQRARDINAAYDVIRKARGWD